MDSGRPNWSQRLGTRLALWYGLILVSVLAMAMVAFYSAMVGTMRHHADSRIFADATQVSKFLHAGKDAEVKAFFAERTRLAGAGDIYFVLRGADGKVLAQSDLSEWRRFPMDWPAGAADKGPVFDYRSGPDGHDRVRVARMTMVGGKYLYDEGLSTQADFHVIENSRIVFVLTLASLATLAMAFALVTARRAVAGMTRVTETASDIARSAELHRRVPVPDRRDEVNWQARTFNAMLDRIERIVGDMRSTNDNIAHELRSPVACIRGAAEAALMSPHTAEEYQGALASMVEECDRLLEIINTMLAIADTNAGVGLNREEVVSLPLLAKWGCDLFAPVAEEKGVVLTLDATAAPAIRGDGARLRRCLANLLDNAIKYAPEGSEVRVQVAQDGGRRARIEVSNACAPLAEEDWQRLFNRFFRGHNAKGKPGTGLGLSLARSIARAHGGDLLAAPGGDGRSITVTLVLPLDDPKA